MGGVRGLGAWNLAGTLVTYLIWLVETVSLNQACKAIFFYGGRGQIC